MNFRLIDTSSFLMHYGVKGMKWGVRHDKPTSGEKRERGAQAVRDKLKSMTSKARNYTGTKRSDAVVNYRHQDVNKMSNKELQDAITRMNLEKQYRQLTSVDYMAGKKYASQALQYENTYKNVTKMSSVAAARNAMKRKAVKKMIMPTVVI